MRRDRIISCETIYGIAEDLCLPYNTVKNVLPGKCRKKDIESIYYKDNWPLPWLRIIQR